MAWMRCTRFVCTIPNLAQTPIEIARNESDIIGLKIDIRVIESGKVFELTSEFCASELTNIIDSGVKVHTSNREYPFVEIPVLARVTK